MRSPALPAAHRWYGLQTLATDGAGLVLVAYGFSHGAHGVVPIAAAGTGGAMLLFGGPLVHVAHGRLPAGLVDLGLRMALPLLGAYVASMSCGGGECGTIALGALLVVSPIVIDAAILAREEVRPEGAAITGACEAPRSPIRAATLRPLAQIGRRSFALGVGGTF